MKIDLFFISYLTISLIVWIILIILRLRRKLKSEQMVYWMVATANPIGLILFLCHRKSIVTSNK